MNSKYLKGVLLAQYFYRCIEWHFIFFSMTPLHFKRDNCMVKRKFSLFSYVTIYKCAQIVWNLKKKLCAFCSVVQEAFLPQSKHMQIRGIYDSKLPIRESAAYYVNLWLSCDKAAIFPGCFPFCTVCRVKYSSGTWQWGGEDTEFRTFSSTLMNQNKLRLKLRSVQQTRSLWAVTFHYIS